MHLLTEEEIDRISPAPLGELTDWWTGIDSIASNYSECAIGPGWFTRSGLRPRMITFNVNPWRDRSISWETDALQDDNYIATQAATLLDLHLRPVFGCRTCAFAKTAHSTYWSRPREQHVIQSWLPTWSRRRIDDFLAQVACAFSRSRGSGREFVSIRC